VQNKPAYLAIGIDTDGDKHVLGIWVPKTTEGSPAAGESAGFWRSVTTDLRNRGVQDILIACCDGLSGFEDAIHTAFPHATVQTSSVHTRSWRDRLAGHCAAPGTTYAGEYLRGPDADLPARGGGGLHIGQRESRFERRDEVPRKSACAVTKPP
jgi:hypothetical protein